MVKSSSAGSTRWDLRANIVLPIRAMPPHDRAIISAIIDQPHISAVDSKEAKTCQGRANAEVAPAEVK